MKLATPYIYLCCVFLLIAITSFKGKTPVILQGNIIGLKSKYVYLHYNYAVGGPRLDSALINNGKFKFTFNPDTLFQPSIARLEYIDNNKRRKNFLIFNPFKNSSETFRFTSNFMLEPGITILTGNIKDSTQTMRFGPQNEFFFKNYSLVGTKISADSIKRAVQATWVENIVTQNPNAYWAFYSVRNFQYGFTNQQLRDIYNKFSDEVKQSYSGKKFKYFIDNQPKNKDYFFNNTITDTGSGSVAIIDTAKKLNIIVFWASWCAPCREEIPVIKKLVSELANNHLRVVSVSIDVDKAKWLKAVGQEKMPWQQLIINHELREVTNAQYNIDAVPLIYLVTNKNRVIKRLTSLDENSMSQLKNFIDQYLARN